MLYSFYSIICCSVGCVVSNVLMVVVMLVFMLRKLCVLLGLLFMLW